MCDPVDEDAQKRLGLTENGLPRLVMSTAAVMYPASGLGLGSAGDVPTLQLLNDQTDDIPTAAHLKERIGNDVPALGDLMAQGDDVPTQSHLANMNYADIPTVDDLTGQGGGTPAVVEGSEPQKASGRSISSEQKEKENSTTLSPDPETSSSSALHESSSGEVAAASRREVDQADAAVDPSVATATARKVGQVQADVAMVPSVAMRYSAQFAILFKGTLRDFVRNPPTFTLSSEKLRSIFVPDVNDVDMQLRHMGGNVSSQEIQNLEHILFLKLTVVGGYNTLVEGGSVRVDHTDLDHWNVIHGPVGEQRYMLTVAPTAAQIPRTMLVNREGVLDSKTYHTFGHSSLTTFRGELRKPHDQKKALSSVYLPVQSRLAAHIKSAQAPLMRETGWDGAFASVWVDADGKELLDSGDQNVNKGEIMYDFPTTVVEKALGFFERSIPKMAADISSGLRFTLHSPSGTWTNPNFALYEDAPGVVYVELNAVFCFPRSQNASSEKLQQQQQQIPKPATAASSKTPKPATVASSKTPSSGRGRRKSVAREHT